MRKTTLLILSLSMSVSLVACSGVENEQVNQTENIKSDIEKDTENIVNDSSTTIGMHEFYEEHKGKLEHIHGLGYAGNQNAIFFAAHDGLKVYEKGNWYKTKEQNSDYMGFNAVDKGFYTSGHPGPGVNLPNPIGLKKSFDNGQTLENLGLEGESDFHAMGVGYENHTVYVLNGEKNSKMDTGLYVTNDDGASWSEIKASNLGENIFSISVHPTNNKLVAVAGEKGVFLSEDGGQSFNLITSNVQGTSTYFAEDFLFYGAYDKDPVLFKYSIDSEEHTEMNLPELKNDAVMYLAQNPQNQDEMVFASFNGNVYLSEDGASNWNPIVLSGKIQ